MSLPKEKIISHAFDVQIINNFKIIITNYDESYFYDSNECEKLKYKLFG